MKKIEVIYLKSKWISWLKDEKRLSLNTVMAYERDLKNFFKFLMDYFSKEIVIDIFESLDEKSIRSWFFWKLKKGSKSRSNARSLSSIKSFILFLNRKNIIKNPNIINIKAPKFSSSLPRPLSDQQVEKIIYSLKKNKYEWIARRNLSIIFLMWGFGLRISEVLNLRFKDIKEDGVIYIQGKGGKQRIVPIYPEIIKYIKEMIECNPFKIINEDFIFIGQRGKKLHPTIVQKEIRQLRLQHHLPDNTTPHSFRHTFATILLNNRVDLRSIQELLGHDSLSSTQKYTQVDSKRIKEVIDNFHPRSSNKL